MALKAFLILVIDANAPFLLATLKSSSLYCWNSLLSHSSVGVGAVEVGSAVGPGDGLVVGPGDGLVVGPGDGLVVGPGDGLVVGPGDGLVVVGVSGTHPHFFHPDSHPLPVYPLSYVAPGPQSSLHVIESLIEVANIDGGWHLRKLQSTHSV